MKKFICELDVGSCKKKKKKKKENRYKWPMVQEYFFKDLQWHTANKIINVHDGFLKIHKYFFQILLHVKTINIQNSNYFPCNKGQTRVHYVFFLHVIDNGDQLFFFQLYIIYKCPFFNEFLLWSSEIRWSRVKKKESCFNKLKMRCYVLQISSPNTSGNYPL